MEPMILRFALDDGSEVELVLNRIFKAENGKSYAVLYQTSEDIEEIDMESDDRILLHAIPKPLEAGQEPVNEEQPEMDYALESIEDEQEYQYAYDAFTALLHEEMLAEMNETEPTIEVEIDGEPYKIADIFEARGRQYAALVKQTNAAAEEIVFHLFRYDETDSEDSDYADINVTPIPSSMEYQDVKETFEKRTRTTINGD